MPLVKTSVLNKTERGREAIAQRSAELGPRLRPILIMIDGKRTVAELEKLAESMGGLEALSSLVDNGFAEAASSVAVPVQAVAPVPASGFAASQPASDVLSLSDFKREVASFFDQNLGPSSTMLVIQIQAAATVRDLKPLVARGVDNLKFFKGAAAVTEFDRNLGSRMPRA